MNTGTHQHTKHDSLFGSTCLERRELFDEKNRKNSLDKDEKSESKEQKDHEIGFYIHLTDDFSTETMVKDKGDHYLFRF